VLFLLLVLFVSATALTVLLWVVTLFFQGYFYTEPTDQIQWQAPAAGAALAIFFTLWCLLVYNSVDAGSTDLPYNDLFRFSPRVDLSKDPIKELWAERKGPRDKEAKVIHYKKTYIPGTRPPRFGYTDAATRQQWQPRDVVAILIPVEGSEKIRMEVVPPPKGSDYREFVDRQRGWVMREYDDGPDGLVSAFRLGRFLLNLFLNLLHLGLWFVCLWLILRFQWGHALGLAFVLWLVTTLAVLPMVLSEAADRGRALPTSGAAAAFTPLAAQRTFSL
jgi:hypothetical protein